MIKSVLGRGNPRPEEARGPVDDDWNILTF